MADVDRTVLASVGLGALALLWRIRVAGRYDGHEEEDWGNLEIVRGVVDSNFGYVETEHMPLFAWVSAVVARLVGDVPLACVSVAVVAGAVAVGLTVWIGEKHLGRGVGIGAGALLVLQPEALLYSATPLRESLYMALALGGMAAVAARHAPAAGGLLALAFLARFNAAFTLLPALAWWAWRTDDPALKRKLAGAAAGIAVVVLLWAGFYHSETGNWTFWGGVVSANTGNAVTDLSVSERLVASGGAVLGVFGWVLPAHVGWAVVPLAAWGGWRAWLSAEEGPRWIGLCTVATLALLAVTAVMTTYDRTHNLWWKWITPSVPLLLLLAVYGALEAARGRNERLVQVAAVVLATATVLGYSWETDRQQELSEVRYGTQVDLAKWAEEAWPAGTSVLTEGIPASYLRSRRSSTPVLLWTDPSLPHDDPAAFGEWLLAHRVGLVMWYREEWTGAAEAAGYLAAPEPRALGRAKLEPVVDERSYGLIAFQVLGPGIPEPTRPAPAVAGRRGR